MRRLLLVLCVLALAVPVQAQAPTKDTAAVLVKEAQADLQDARDEMVAAAKELQASEPFKRYDRAKRMTARAEARLKAAQPEPPKPETGSK